MARVVINLLIFLAFPFEVLPAQLTRSKDFFCRNELVQLNCTVRSGVLEWRFNPQSLPSKSGSFFRGIDALNRELTTSWPGLTMRLTYVAANATHMESTAHFVAASEFHRMAITCAGQSEASMVLMIASGDLFAVDSVHLSVHKNFSETNLMLSWDEPSLSGRPSVDYYLVEVNKMEFNFSSTSADVNVTYSESINITIRYSNCLELSPSAKFNLSLLEGQDGGGCLEQPNFTTTQYPVLPDTSTQSTTLTTASKNTASSTTDTLVTTIAVDEMLLCHSFGTPIFISAILGTFVATVIGMLLLFVTILKVKEKRSNSTDTAVMNNPVYEAVEISKDKLELSANTAYNL